MIPSLLNDFWMSNSDVGVRNDYWLVSTIKQQFSGDHGGRSVRISQVSTVRLGLMMIKRILSWCMDIESFHCRSTPPTWKPHVACCPLREMMYTAVSLIKEVKEIKTDDINSREVVFRISQWFGRLKSPMNTNIQSRWKKFKVRKNVGCLLCTILGRRLVRKRRLRISRHSSSLDALCWEFVLLLGRGRIF